MNSPRSVLLLKKSACFGTRDPLTFVEKYKLLQALDEYGGRPALDEERLDQRLRNIPVVIAGPLDEHDAFELAKRLRRDGLPACVGRRGLLGKIQALFHAGASFGSYIAFTILLLPLILQLRQHWFEAAICGAIFISYVVQSLARIEPLFYIPPAIEAHPLHQIEERLERSLDFDEIDALIEEKHRLLSGVGDGHHRDV